MDRFFSIKATVGTLCLMILLNSCGSYSSFGVRSGWHTSKASKSENRLETEVKGKDIKAEPQVVLNSSEENIESSEVPEIDLAKESVIEALPDLSDLDQNESILVYEEGDLAIPSFVEEDDSTLVEQRNLATAYMAEDEARKARNNAVLGFVLWLLPFTSLLGIIFLIIGNVKARKALSYSHITRKGMSMARTARFLSNLVAVLYLIAILAVTIFLLLLFGVF